MHGSSAMSAYPGNGFEGEFQGEPCRHVSDNVPPSAKGARMPDEPSDLIAQLLELVDVFQDEGLAITQCGPTIALGYSIGFTTVWFGSPSESTEVAQSLASSKAFKHCLNRCGSLKCPPGRECVFDTEANEGFTDRCRYFSIYLGIVRRYLIRWHVSLAFAKCPCVCKCQ
jgi:hypothetical protein